MLTERKWKVSEQTNFMHVLLYHKPNMHLSNKPCGPGDLKDVDCTFLVVFALVVNEHST